MRKLMAGVDNSSRNQPRHCEDGSDEQSRFCQASGSLRFARNDDATGDRWNCRPLCDTPSSAR